MTTYARIIDGFAVDVIVSPPTLEQRFHPDWLARNPFIVVPDGTLAGAKDNGNGTFSNPAPVVPVFADLVLSKSDFIDHCITQFGGVQRFGLVMAAAKTAVDGTVAAYYEKYTSIATITKAQAQAFYTAVRTAALPAGAVVSVAEITAVVSNWPKG